MSEGEVASELFDRTLDPSDPSNPSFRRLGGPQSHQANKGRSSGWLRPISAVWILVAGIGGALIGAGLSSLTCDDTQDYFECSGDLGGGLFFGFLLGLTGGWLISLLLERLLPRMRGPILLIATTLTVCGVVLAFTLPQDDGPSRPESPYLEFGPNDALP